MSIQGGTSVGSITYFVKITIPKKVCLFSTEGGERVEIEREQFYEWLWAQFASKGLIGIHEGTVLSEEAAREGFETDSWTVDSGEAPHERDWIAQQESVVAEVFFATEEQAIKIIQVLSQIENIQIGSVVRQEPQDWDAQWKASFLNDGRGIFVEPFWRIMPPWSELQPGHEKLLRINPGAGFGTGTHETTQLCLEAIGRESLKTSLKNQKALDFGSGSGILSIALALLGAEVDAVEVDSLAIDNAKENAALNAVLESQIRWEKSLGVIDPYQVVVANILRPVLLEFSTRLTERMAPGATLILSGLIQSDVNPVVQCYAELLPNHRVTVTEKGEWRGIIFSKDHS